MQNLVSDRFERIWKKFQRKNFREGFVESHLTSNIAAQVATLRQDRGWTQTHLAKLAKMRQSQISELENPSFSGLTLKTLAKIASAFDVAVIIRFVRFSDVAQYATDETQGKYSVPSFADDRPPTSKVVTWSYESLLPPAHSKRATHIPDPTHSLIEFSGANRSRQSGGETLHPFGQVQVSDNEVEAPNKPRPSSYQQAGTLFELALPQQRSAVR